MHIYDVTNPHGLFCQSKSDVKYKQHLILLKTIHSLPSFLLFVLLLYQWQLATVGNKFIQDGFLMIYAQKRGSRKLEGA